MKINLYAHTTLEVLIVLKAERLIAGEIRVAIITSC